MPYFLDILRITFLPELVNGIISSSIGLGKVKKLYVASDDSLIVVDSEKDEVAKTISVKDKPMIISADQDKNLVYIQLGSSSIEEVDGNSDTIKNSLKININKVWFDTKNSRFYILGPDGKSLSAVDQNGLKIIKTVDLGGSYQEMAVASWLNRIYLLDSGNNKLLILNGSSLNRISTIDIAAASSDNAPSATAIYPNEKANKIYLTHRYGQITVVDPVTNKVSDIISLSYGANPMSLQVDPDLGRLYVANKWLNQVQVYSLTDYTLQAEIDAQGETHWVK